MAIFNGAAGRDILPFLPFPADQLPDLVVTATGNDVIDGAAGDDVLIGWQGNDTLRGGTGADYLIGGNLFPLSGGAGPWEFQAAGSDTADYSTSAIGVLVDLSIMHGLRIAFDHDWGTQYGGSALSLGVVYGRGGDAQGDRLINISNLTGSTQKDFLGGNVDANILRGGAGDDTLRGGAGADVLDGGDGIDMADYSTAGSGVAVALLDDGAVGGGTRLDGSDADGDALINIEWLRGGGFDDNLTGNEASNLLSGGGGSDVVTGWAGRDALFGGAGNDRLTGGAGADYLQGGSGADTFVYTFERELGYAQADLIADFSSAEGDKIDLQGISPLYGHATFIGTAQFSGQDHPEVRAVSRDHQTSVFLDLDGNGSVDLQIRLSGAMTLTASDFIL